ncbi:hypothetical protein QTP88_022543 [Uroleucon formosanum]
MTDDSHARDYILDRNVRSTFPPDQINRLSYCLHPDGYINPYETPVTLTEYQLKYCTFKLENTKQLDVSRAERNRVLALMENLSTVQQRSYTNPHDSHYPVIGSTAIKPALDRSKEAEMRNFKMNGWSEYQAVYDRYGYKVIA